MTKQSDAAVSGALKSNPKQNAREAEEANKAMRERREADQDQEALGGNSVEERFGSPD